MASAEPEENATAAAQTNAPGGASLGGAQAEFVASLGRKLEGARQLLTALTSDPRARVPREELRRRLHALGAAARMMHFDAMARCVGEACAVLDRAAVEGSATRADLSQ